MLRSAHIDFETRSRLDLKKVGVHRYAADPSTSVWWLYYSFDGIVYNRWKPGDPFPANLAEHVAAGGRVVAHNAAFERTIWNIVLIARMGLPLTRMTIEQQDCTMARALVLAIPADLDRAVQVLGGAVQKDEEGHRLMLKMMKPKKNGEWETDPVKIERLGQYCQTDVAAEIGIDKIAPPLSARERRVWELDQHINDRGVAIDVDLVQRLLGVAEEAKKRATWQITQLTGGAVTKVTETAKIVAWLNSRGIECTSIAAEETEDLLIATDVVGDETAAAVIELRRAVAKASTSKLEAALRCVDADGRARGLMSYHVASTGRWAGRRVQPQNLVRVDDDAERPTVMLILKLVRSVQNMIEAYERIDLVVGTLIDKEYKLNGVMPWLAKCIRPIFISAPGYKLLGADLSNIEGRVNAWIAGEEWKLEAFRAYDAGIGPDLYRLSYGKSFNVTDLKSILQTQRQIGKVQELALGYQGSVGAYLDMGKNYGLKPHRLALAVREVTSDRDWDLVAADYASATNKSGLSAFDWTGLKIVVNGFRKANANIVQSWWDLQDAALAAVGNPGVVFPVCGGKVRYLCNAGFLWCSLPSTRVLAYATPRIVERAVNADQLFYTAAGEKRRADEVFDSEPLFHEDGTPVSQSERHGRVKRTVQFMGLDLNNVWRPQYLYGGLQCNNVVQGTARDVIVEKMELVELMGYPVVLHVHDELVAEIRQELGDCTADFQRLMSLAIPFLPGMPIASKAWQDERYIK